MQKLKKYLIYSDAQIKEAYEKLESVNFKTLIVVNKKNKFLGTTTWDECAKRLTAKNIKPTNVVLLRENDTLNIEYGVADKKYEPINLEEMKRYIEDDLSRIKYPYQLEPAPNKEQLKAALEELKNA